MSNFNPNPVFSVQVSGSGSELTYRISFFMPSSAGVRTQGRTAFLKTKADAAVEIAAVPVASSNPTLVNIMASVPGAEAALSVELGTVRFEQGGPSVVELELLESAVGQASFLALSSVSVSAVPVMPLYAPEAAEQVAPIRKVVGAGSRMTGVAAWLRSWRWPVAGLSAVMFVGLMFIGYGLLHKPGEAVAAEQGGEYADLQEKIRKQIEQAAKSGNPAMDSLQGQNVAIATMKAMGLDPGKANAGCLVGVR